MTERANFIESFTQSIDEFEKQQKDFMEQAKTEMKINDTKLEKMQNMINYVQITMREKFNEGPIQT